MRKAQAAATIEETADAVSAVGVMPAEGPESIAPTQEAPSTWVPGRQPGRDADGERPRTRYRHPGRTAENDAAPVPTGAAEHDAQSPADLLNALAAKIGPLAFERYFQGQAKLERIGNGLRVVVASRFLVSILESRFRPVLLDLAGGGEVEFIDKPTAFPKAKAKPIKATKAERPVPQEQAPRPHHALQDRTVRLDDFVVGESNRLAHMAATTLSDPNSPPTSGNLLVLHGGCGLGKTHLLRGMAHNHNRLRGSAGKAKYVTAEQFTNGFLAALRTGSTDRFREQYRGVELLCLDDVHFLATKEATKAELLHTLDQILQGGCRLALASDEHPKQVEGLGKQLVSRLLSGLTIELGLPERDLREAMVRKLAARRGLMMDDAVVTSIAQAGAEISEDGEPSGSFRDIEGAMARVDAFHNLLGRVGDRPAGHEVTMATVQQALGRRAAMAKPAGPVRVSAVIEGVCRYLGVGQAEFTGRGRHRRVVLARALVALISRQLTTASYPEIATAMGRPNHSSIITAVRRIERQIAEEEKVAVGCDADGMTVAELASSLSRRLRQAGR
ncbi:MAG: ATP-binding protein [Phycisphaerales bacterium]|nr:ATP-binding protein [Phycisphaerales bacterium]